MLLLENMDEQTARVFAALHRTVRLHQQRMSREMAKKNATPPEAFCLSLVAREDGMSQRDLAARLHLSRPWITRLLQTLEKSGAVVRRVDEQDQRLTRVFITESGRERERELRGVMSVYMARTIETLSDDEKDQLSDLLDKMNAGISDDLGGEAPAPESSTHPGHAQEMGS